MVWAIINGEQESGVSLFQLTEKMDAGVLYIEYFFCISKSEKKPNVYEKSEDASNALIKGALPEIIERQKCYTPQDKSMTSLYLMVFFRDGIIDWILSSERRYDFICAQTHPYSSTYTEYEKVKKIIWKAVPCDVSVNGNPPGTWFEDNAINACVACGDGSALRILNWRSDDGS
ncbi:hypothetical protein JCM12178A_07730 [Salidesulfovibrio brasiliensis]